MIDLLILHSERSAGLLIWTLIAFMERSAKRGVAGEGTVRPIRTSAMYSLSNSTALADSRLPGINLDRQPLMLIVSTHLAIKLAPSKKFIQVFGNLG